MQTVLLPKCNNFLTTYFFEFSNSAKFRKQRFCTKQPDTYPLYTFFYLNRLLIQQKTKPIIFEIQK